MNQYIHNVMIVYPGLQHLVSEHNGNYSAEASSFGVMTIPSSIEYNKVVYRRSKYIIDEGDICAAEYQHEGVMFTLRPVGPLVCKSHIIFSFCGMWNTPPLTINLFFMLWRSILSIGPHLLLGGLSLFLYTGK